MISFDLVLIEIYPVYGKKHISVGYNRQAEVDGSTKMKVCQACIDGEVIKFLPFFSCRPLDFLESTRSVTILNVCEGRTQVAEEMSTWQLQRLQWTLFDTYYNHA